MHVCHHAFNSKGMPAGTSYNMMLGSGVCQSASSSKTMQGVADCDTMVHVQMSVSLQATAEALTDSAPGLPSPFERASNMVNSFVGRREEQVSIPEEPIQELDMSIKTDSINTDFFADPGANGIKLRGPTYLEDKKKVASHLQAKALDHDVVWDGGGRGNAVGGNMIKRAKAVKLSKQTSLHCHRGAKP